MPVITNYDVDLDAIYGIDKDDYASIVSDKFANRAAAAAVLIGFDAYWDFMALSDADFNDANFMACSWLSAIANDAMVWTDGYIGQGPYPDDGVASRCNIILPHGGYMVNFPILMAHGKITGKGSANYTNHQLQIHSAGTAAVNGTYDRSGSRNGRPRYQLGATASDEVYFNNVSNQWEIYAGGVLMYHSTSNDLAGNRVSYPHKAALWVTDAGAGPVPTVQRPSASGTTGGFMAIIDHTAWLTSCMADRNCFQSAIFGDLSGYAEGEIIEGVSCDGAVQDVDAWIASPGHYDPSYQSSGIAMWSAGSVSCIKHCKCDNFNDFGFYLADKTTPGTLINNRGFLNQRGSIGFIGGGTLFVYSHECDGSPAVFYARLRPGGGPCATHITAVGIKVEDGVAPQIPYPKGCCIADLEAWTHLSVNGASMASTASYPDVLVRVKTTANSSYVNIENLKIWGYYRTLMHDVTNKKKWLLDMGEYEAKWFSSIHQFRWVSNNGGRLTCYFRTPRQINNCAEGRLQWISDAEYGGGVRFDDVAGTPAYIP